MSVQGLCSRDLAAAVAASDGGDTTIYKQTSMMGDDKAAGTTRQGLQQSNQGGVVLGLLANLKQHARLSEACLVEATSDNNLSVEGNSMSN
jgi:hypothetical protein